MTTKAKARVLAALIVTGAAPVSRGAENNDGEIPPGVEKVVQNPTALTPPRLLSARLQSPLSVSAVLNFPMINGGVDVSYQLTDRFGIGGQLTTMLVHTELTARARFFVLAGATSGLYVGLNGVLVHSPLIFNFPAVGTTAELGFEVRRDAWVFGFGAGAGALWSQSAEGRPLDDGNWEPYPLINLRVGRARP